MSNFIRNFLLTGLILCLSFQVGLVFSQTNIQFLSKVSYQNAALSNLWGYSANGREYALVGLSTGVSIVDITQPTQPQVLFFVQGPPSIWREIKVWDRYAYITNETDSGLLIIDLSQLPNQIDHNFYNAGGEIKTAHTIWIDERGIAYINGYNTVAGIAQDNRGILFLDLNTNPLNPTVIGSYNEAYVHDCFVRGDTLYTGEIFRGFFRIIDVSNKSLPIVKAEQSTPGRFTHNVWPSDDNRFLFTTDEISGGVTASYEIGNINNIRYLDAITSHATSGIIPHNTQYLGGFLVNSHYRDGIRIVDAHRPQNLVEVGFYDTSPFPSADGFNGCWGVYPFFASGLIIASDIEEGLFILQPTYQRAAYLEGLITLSSNGVPLSGVQVEIIGKDYFKFSDISGEYKTGALEGRYDVRFSRRGCETEIVGNVDLVEGQITILNLAMSCDSSVLSSPEQRADPVFRVFPTLFSDVLHVEAAPENLSLGSNLLQGFFVGMDGRRLGSFSAKGAAISLNTENWIPGYYLYIIQIGNQQQMGKIYKAR